jgi:hypothetical protein
MRSPVIMTSPSSSASSPLQHSPLVAAIGGGQGHTYRERHAIGYLYLCRPEKTARRRPQPPRQSRPRENLFGGRRDSSVAFALPPPSGPPQFDDNRQLLRFGVRRSIASLSTGPHQLT